MIIRRIHHLLMPLLVLLSGCGPQEAIPPDAVVLRFSFWGGFLELDMWEDIIADFQAKYPKIRIIPEYTPDHYDTKLRLGFISGKAPDIVAVDDDWFPMYALRGNLVNLDPFIRRDEDSLRIDHFFPTSLKSFQFDGHQFGMPWDGFNEMLYYNEEIFDRYDEPYPRDEWTWEDFRQAALRLTHDTDGDGRTDVFGALIGASWMSLQTLMWSNGGSILDESRTRFTMDSPEVYAGLRFFQDLKYKQHVMPLAGDLGGMYGEIMLLTGRVAMLTGPAYIMLNLHATRGMRWNVTHMPRGPAGRATRVSWDGIAIYSGTPHQEEAWRFIRHILSPKSQRRVGGLKRALPVRPEDAYASFVDPETPQDEEKFIEAFSYARLSPNMESIGVLRVMLQEAADKIDLNSTTPEQAIAELKPQAERLLREMVAERRTRSAQTEPERP